MNVMERMPVGVKFEALEQEKNEQIFNKQGDSYQNEGTRKGGEEKEREKDREGEWEQIKERDGEGMEKFDEKKCSER